MSASTYEIPHHSAAFPDAWSKGSGDPIVVRAPATGAVLGSIGSSTAEDLDRTTASACVAQREWAALTYDRRAAVLLEAATLLTANPERLKYWLVHEAGSGQGKATNEVNLVASELQESASLASHPYGELLRSSKPRLSMARRVPIGVVGVISPFNFPALLAMRSIAPALALGNAVILKPDPRTSVSGGLALAALLEDAGLPSGVLHVLPGRGDLGEALVAHPEVPCITFTGSTVAGRRIAASAGPLLKKLHLELGGNNALLVLPDADVEAAASTGAWSSFLHQGQICMTAGRHLVHRSISDRYLAALTEKARNIPVGNPADPTNSLGPIIDAHQRDRVHGLVRDSVNSGATVLTGGQYTDLFYEPTVITNLSAGSPIWAEEIFGPVAPVMIYDDVSEAIDLINSSEYGLSVSILTADPYKAFELAEHIDSGAVHINDSTVDDEAPAPFGGRKASGVGGRFGGPTANLDTFTETQWITVQGETARYPF